MKRHYAGSTLMIAYLQLAGSMIMVGANVAIAKALLVEVPPFLLAWLRFSLVGLLLLPVPLRLPNSIWRLAARQWLTLLGLGLFGVVLFNLALLYGLRLTSATDAAIVTSVLPAVIALLSVPLLGEKPDGRGIIAIILSVAGMLSVALPSASNTVGSLSGNGLIFGAVVSEALYIIVSRKLGGTFPVFFMIWLLNAIGVVAMVPLAVYEWQLSDLAHLPLSIWGLMVVYSLSTGFLAFVLWFTGIRHVPANRAGVFTSLLPVSAALVAVTALGENFTLTHAIGMALVLSSLLFGFGFGARQAES